MRKLPVIAAAAVGLTTASLVVPPAAFATHHSGTTKTYVIEVTKVKVIDIGESGASHGDIAVRNGIIMNSKGKKVGTFTTTHVTVDVDQKRRLEDRQVSVQFDLGGGSIMATGTITAVQGGAVVGPQVFAIVGGIGKFAGSTGTLTITPSVDPNQRSAVLSFL